MNAEQNATIPDGSVVLQILIRFWAGFQYYQKYVGKALVVSDISLPFHNGFDWLYWKNKGNSNSITSFITNKLYSTVEFSVSASLINTFQWRLGVFWSVRAAKKNQLM